MNSVLAQSNNLAGLLKVGLGVPVLVFLTLAMMIVPLPPLVLDVLFTFNITLSLVLLLAVIYALRPLDLAVFPTVLLGATILRLALNVASTRVVLLNGHAGGAAAGNVIEAFGSFVVGGNYAVGLVVFVILVIINFVVITKGAGRVSEVTARFTLDAMPGKQMAIDADLNAGIINSEEAQVRRREVREEADFYGSMDGASKFVRGDAVAGILILFINIIGGLLVGTLQHDLPMAVAMENYTLLTIGDGLVAQIPSLLLSVAVAVVVTRVSRSEDMSTQVLTQVFADPRVLGVSAGLLGILGIVPGMPNVAFLSLAAVCGGAAWMMRSRPVETKEPVREEPEAAPVGDRDLSWEDVGSLDVLGLEVGYRLIPMVDRKRGGELMARIKGVRKKISEQLGFLLPPVHIRDNLECPPNVYRISLMGVPVAEDEVHPDKLLAINPGQASSRLTGIATKDPAFGLEAYWIDGATRDHAQTLGYTVVDPATVVATHLSQIMQNHAQDLLGHEEVQKLLDRLKETAPKLVEELVPKTLSLAVIVRVMQMLLAEKISVRNIRRIAETLAEHGSRVQDPDALVAKVRVALSRSIVQGIAGMRADLPVMTLDAGLEQLLVDATQAGGTGAEPGLTERLVNSLSQTTARQTAQGEPAVLLVPSQLRPWLARLARHSVQGLHVLAFEEIPEDKGLKVVAAVGAGPALAR